MTAREPEVGGAFAPGSTVLIRGEEWLVSAVEDTTDGQLVHVQGLGELVRDTSASFYCSLDEIVPLEPVDATVVADDSPRYRTARLWLESTIRKTPHPIGEQALSVATRGLADALSYQQSAVRKALDPANLRPRLLLADAVGLGKTLEIGMILSELVRRGRGDRILVVTPRHVLEQMQHELWCRFALPFVRLDSAGIQRVRQKLPATRNPFTYFKRAIISIDTLKSDRYVASLSKQRWDAVVIDESHNLSNSATLNNRLARILARNAEALILASATPHNGRADSFAELLRLLDPSAVTPDGRLDKDEVRRLVVRRHRHSPEVAQVVGADWASRQEPENVLVPATAEENAVAGELADTWLWPGSGGSPYSGQNASLFPWTLAKAFLSSPVALRESIEGRLGRLGKDDRAARERQSLHELAGLNDKCRTSAKYQRLVEHLKKIGVAKNKPVRAVVFAERLETLRWLRRSLPKDLDMPADAVALMHGGLADDEQQAVVEAFKQEQAPVRVLVTGDVASEGVNLHAQCHHLIHYDIPWSLIRIEQRNGRIDRYGQKHPPLITALLLDPDGEKFAGDVRILARLLEKENEAHTALGDVASLMGHYDVKSEEDDIRAVLAGRKDLDDVVRPVADVAAGNDLTALFAQLFDTPTTPTPEPSRPETIETGPTLYPDDVSYLEDALHVRRSSTRQHHGPRAGSAGVGTSTSAPPNWSHHPIWHSVSTCCRSDTLPNGRSPRNSCWPPRRRAARTGWPLRCATPRSSAGRTRTTSRPLHPVLDWAADRALAALGRNEVFAVRGVVDAPTVLLVGTLTNKRGQVVAVAWLTAQFPDQNDSSFALVAPHASARDALVELGWDQARTNPGPVDVTNLKALVGPAVQQAERHLRTLFDAAAKDVASRVEQWSTRLDHWDVEAEALIQRSDLKRRRATVDQERAMVAAMAPDRQLVRPLLIVVPETEGQK